MLFRFENGTMAYINANQKVADFQPDIDIYGTKGRIVGRNVTRAFLDGELRVKIGDRETTTAYTSRDAFDRQVAAFNRAVLEDREPNASGLDGLRSVQLTDAILKSAREGVRVKLR
jgi:1,5-anhydro-D-fructose reductase (1,5-anhydro-D-mannitol-forming)